MQLFRFQLCLPLLVWTCWTVFPGVDGLCGSVAECLNRGTCNTGTCDCADTGYRGEACDTDINECTKTGDDAHDCDENGACTNTPLGSYTCTCNGGFVGDGKTCTAIVCTKDGNECLNGGTCDIPTGGTGGTCSCQSGYDGPICADDIKECTETGDDAHDCDENAACTNTPAGSYTCTCNGGFVGDGKTCTAIVCTEDGNECLNGGTCDIPTDGTGGICSCQSGYDGPICADDINECTETGDDAHDCDENAACTNTPPGSYTCTCNEGFVGDEKTCTASGASKILVHILLITVVAVLAQLSLN